MLISISHLRHNVRASYMNNLNYICLLLLFSIFVGKCSSAAKQEETDKELLRINPDDILHLEKSKDRYENSTNNTSISNLILKKDDIVDNTSRRKFVNANEHDVAPSSTLTLTRADNKIKAHSRNNNDDMGNVNMEDQIEAQNIVDSMGLSELKGKYVSGRLIKPKFDHSPTSSNKPPTNEKSSFDGTLLNANQSKPRILKQSEINDYIDVPNAPYPERVITAPEANEEDSHSLDKLTNHKIPEPQKILETIDHLKSNLDGNITIQSFNPNGNEHIVNIKDAPHLYGDNNCSDNEVYIIDGERTLLLTNKKLTADIEIIQDETLNLQTLIQNQDAIISQLKQRLVNSEAQVDDSLGLLVKHEKSYQILLQELNKTKASANEDKRRNEYLEKQLVKERQGRVQYQELSSHFKKEMDEVNERLDAMMDESNEQCDTTIKELQSKYDICKQKTDDQGVNLEGLYREQNLIKDNLDAFNRTRFRYNKPKCKLIQQQLAVQDNALILLKDQIKAQAHTLESMNRIVSMKHETMENIHNAVR